MDEPSVSCMFSCQSDSCLEAVEGSAADSRLAGLEVEVRHLQQDMSRAFELLRDLSAAYGSPKAGFQTRVDVASLGEAADAGTDVASLDEAADAGTADHVYIGSPTAVAFSGGEAAASGEVSSSVSRSIAEAIAAVELRGCEAAKIASRNISDAIVAVELRACEAAKIAAKELLAEALSSEANALRTVIEEALGSEAASLRAAMDEVTLTMRENAYCMDGLDSGAAARVRAGTKEVAEPLLSCSSLASPLLSCSSVAEPLEPVLSCSSAAEPLLSSSGEMDMQERGTCFRSARLVDGEQGSPSAAFHFSSQPFGMDELQILEALPHSSSSPASGTLDAAPTAPADVMLLALSRERSVSPDSVATPPNIQHHGVSQSFRNGGGADTAMDRMDAALGLADISWPTVSVDAARDFSQIMRPALSTVTLQVDSAPSPEATSTSSHSPAMPVVSGEVTEVGHIARMLSAIQMYDRSAIELSERIDSETSPEMARKPSNTLHSLSSGNPLNEEDLDVSSKIRREAMDMTTKIVPTNLALQLLTPPAKEADPANLSFSSHCPNPDVVPRRTPPSTAQPDQAPDEVPTRQPACTPQLHSHESEVVQQPPSLTPPAGPATSMSQVTRVAAPGYIGQGLARSASPARLGPVRSCSPLRPGPVLMQAQPAQDLSARSPSISVARPSGTVVLPAPRPHDRQRSVGSIVVPAGNSVIVATAQAESRRESPIRNFPPQTYPAGALLNNMATWGAQGSPAVTARGALTPPVVSGRGSLTPQAHGAPAWVGSHPSGLTRVAHVERRPESPLRVNAGPASHLRNLHAGDASQQMIGAPPGAYRSPSVVRLTSAPVTPAQNKQSL